MWLLARCPIPASPCENHPPLLTVAITLVAQHITDIIWAKNSSSKGDSPFTRSRSNSDSMIR